LPPTPEQRARETIDRQLAAAGWPVQRYRDLNVHASRGVAAIEFPLETGPCDYVLYVDHKVVGVVEAKKEGETLTGVELQTERYSEGLPAGIPAPIRPLPFLYQSTGVETCFTSRLDPEPRSRFVFNFHRPEALAEWLEAEPVFLPVGHPLADKPASLRLRLRQLPVLDVTGLWPAQFKAVRNLEKSLADDRPRSLIQMATGSGKTVTAIAAIYRMLKHADAERVLFLVDRGNLAKQALKEFQSFVTPDDGRKFTELYNVQRLTSNRLDPVAKVCICTIQRLYSMLQGKELAEDVDEQSLAGLEALYKEPLPVTYNPNIPVEFFDVIFVDECHRSIYTLWKQVLDYFDAFLVGLTATPSAQTLGFFKQNLVMEYGHAQAVADAVNVDFDVFRIRTRITEEGSKVDAGFFVDRRERETRRVRWEKLDEDLEYPPEVLDRDVIAPDQIRTIVRTFRDALPAMFPARKDVPKTLIYAKDDSHAEDIVRIVREEFAKGNDFAQKITYRTGTARVVARVAGPDGREVEQVTWKSTGLSAEDLLSSFRNSYFPRVAVTVDMIATGTDIKPLEVVMFMRLVRSRNLFEQMKGRGVRVINDTDFQLVNPGAGSKTRFVIVDAVGATEQELSDTRPLERQPTVSLERLLQALAVGNTDPDVVSSVAGRLARLDRQLGKDERTMIEREAGGQSLQAITSGLVAAIDPDSLEQAGESASGIIEEACRPLASNPRLRQILVDLKKSKEQTIDSVSQDAVLEAGFSAAATERARSLVTSFESTSASIGTRSRRSKSCIASRTASGCASTTSGPWPRPSRRRRGSGRRSGCGGRTKRSSHRECVARPTRCSPTWYRWCGLL
jgi:type I restriction enzyme R subunit